MVMAIHVIHRYLYDAHFALENGYNVFWSRPGTWTVTCGRDNPPEPFKESLRNFPFDKTTCKIDIASWLYDSSYIAVSHLGSSDPTDLTVINNTAVEFMITKPVPAEADSGYYQFVQSDWSVLTLEVRGACGSITTFALARIRNLLLRCKLTEIR